MIRKLLVFAAVVVGFTVAASGQNQNQNQVQTAPPGQSEFQCNLFSVDTDSSQMVVSMGKGRLGSGNAGSDKTPPAKPYTVKVTKDTVIHWQGTRERISLRDLREMNIKQLNIPLSIRYDNDQNNPPTKSDLNGQPPAKFTATEVIVMKATPDENTNK